MPSVDSMGEVFTINLYKIATKPTMSENFILFAWWYQSPSSILSTNVCMSEGIHLTRKSSHLIHNVTYSSEEYHTNWNVGGFHKFRKNAKKPNSIILPRCFKDILHVIASFCSAVLLRIYLCLYVWYYLKIKKVR